MHIYIDTYIQIDKQINTWSRSPALSAAVEIMEANSPYAAIANMCIYNIDR